MEELEQINSDVQNEASSEPQTESAEAPQAEQSAQAGDINNQTEDKQVPFHEHPRFRELVEQKNQFASRVKEYEQRLSDMDSRLKQASEAQKVSQTQEDKLISRLKQIDPEFGGRIEEMHNKLSKLDQFEQWQQQMEVDRVRTQAVQTINSLHTENKVPKEWQEVINSQIELSVMRNPNLGIQDLPNVYKQVHSSFSKLMEGVKRSERESYVVDKKQDAKTPQTPKGKPVSSAPSKSELSNNPDEARNQLVSQVLKEMRAGRNT